jgi:hypothetical protein
VQLAVDLHDTLVSGSDVSGFATDDDHAFPFQRATRGKASSYSPTAMQTVTDGHDTPDSPAERPAAGSPTDVGWIDHRFPFQRSASVSRIPIELWKEPTATQAVVETHETPLSELELAPGGFGLL